MLVRPQFPDSSAQSRRESDVAIETPRRPSDADQPEPHSDVATEGRPATGEWVSGDGDGGGHRATVEVAPRPEASGERPSRWDSFRNLRTFDSLRNANFRWYFLSMFGVFGAMNMQMLVRGFVVYQMTGSYTALGTIGLANALPGMIVSLPGGVIADRVPKKLVQQIGSAANAVNAFWVAAFMVAGTLRFEHLLINGVIQGVIQGLMMPSRQSMLSDIVYPRHLMNAIALNNAAMGISRMIMPTIGGIILAVTHAYWAFFMMGGLYLFSVATLVRVPSKPIEIPEEEKLFQAEGGGRRMGMRGGGHGGGGKSAGGVKDLVLGFKYIASDRTVGLLLLVNFLMVLLSMPYMQMLPGFVSDVLADGDSGRAATMQGALMAISSIGALAAALGVASLPNKHRGKVLIGGGLLLGVSLTIFSFSNWFWVTAPVMVALGAGQSMRMALSNSLIQSYTDPEYRGRVMSIFMMEMNLVMVGAFMLSLLADVIGAQMALGLASLALVGLCFLTYAFIPRVRNIQ